MVIDSALSESIWFLVVVCGSLVIGIAILRKLHVAGGVRKFELLLSYIGAFSALMFTYDIYITIGSDNRIEKNRIAYDTLQNIQRNYLSPQKEMVDSYPESFVLYTSMNPDVDFEGLTPKKIDQAHQAMSDVYSSLRIFQSMEDFLSTVSYDITGAYVWINNYLMWMQSPILQEQWKRLAFNYADDTRQLVERIIEKANELSALRKQKGSLNAADYDAISKNFSITGRQS